ncbi:MAG: AAA family ATPase [archaeon]|nr:AAA family ATPase [archaeon]
MKSKKRTKRHMQHRKIRRTRIKKHAKSGKVRVIRIKDGRIPSGVPNFDCLVEGGFEKSSTNLIVGGAGSGKSIFATQFIMEGIELGENCLYVTFEEKKEQFYKNMLEFGWDLSKHERKGRLVFLEYTPEKVKNMLEEGGGAVESIIMKKKIKRVVIDSITSFELLFQDEFAKREAALSLFNMINNWGCTSLLTLEEENSNETKMASRALEFESDSIVLLYYIRKDGERERFLEILKMRGTEHSNKLYRFEMTKKGIVVDKKPARISARI